MNSLNVLIWPSMLAIPLLFQNNYHAVSSIDGLLLGIGSVLFGQFVTLLYYCSNLNNPKIQQIKEYDTEQAIYTHILQPEGFLLLGIYLYITWYCNMLPLEYYQYNGYIQWERVFSQLLCQDFIQYIMHRMEHSIQILYKYTHYRHHVHIKPTLFHSFDGSIGDTVVMIIIPLYTTTVLIPTNVWSYMVFGTLYANWLTLIHSEFEHVWDPYFKTIGFGTPKDHHVHHKTFKYNYGHLFMYWDYFFNTYTSFK